MSEELIKNISLNFPHQEYEENLIILGKDGSLSVLNNTSKFCMRTVIIRVYIH